ncbi:MAG TPA: hypothetical protein VJQ80_15240, partial [Arthrobacter sp.]|nr:hypothetical protein [Arthrobacter sp.]
MADLTFTGQQGSVVCWLSGLPRPFGPGDGNRSNKNVRGHARCYPAGLRQQQLAEGMAKKDGVIEIEGVVTEALP